MLLVRNGLIHTMTKAGTVPGDILIHNGKILQAGIVTEEQKEECTRVIDATGLQICPGLIDVHVHALLSDGDSRQEMAVLAQDTLRAGVTTHALWPDREGQCIIRHGNEVVKPAERMRCIHAEDMTDAQLCSVMEEANSLGERIAVEVTHEKVLKRLLACQKASHASLVLAHLNGCDALLDEVIASGSEVILGACALRGSSSGYALAAKLRSAGVHVALTADYPATRLHHLAVCAGLCERGGMEYQAVLRAITLDAARMLRLDKVCGSVEEGKRADLTLFDGDPLKLATARTATVIGGETVFES